LLERLQEGGGIYQLDPFRFELGGDRADQGVGVAAFESRQHLRHPQIRKGVEFEYLNVRHATDQTARSSTGFKIRERSSPGNVSLGATEHQATALPPAYARMPGASFASTIALNARLFFRPYPDCIGCA
jgi:hypothetical protein